MCLTKLGGPLQVEIRGGDAFVKWIKTTLIAVQGWFRDVSGQTGAVETVGSPVSVYSIGHVLLFTSIHANEENRKATC